MLGRVHWPGRNPVIRPSPARLAQTAGARSTLGPGSGRTEPEDPVDVGLAEGCLAARHGHDQVGHQLDLGPQVVVVQGVLVDRREWPAGAARARSAGGGEPSRSNSSTAIIRPPDPNPASPTPRPSVRSPTVGRAATSGHAVCRIGRQSTTRSAAVRRRSVRWAVRSAAGRLAAEPAPAPQGRRSPSGMVRSGYWSDAARTGNHGDMAAPRPASYAQTAPHVVAPGDRSTAPAAGPGRPGPTRPSTTRPWSRAAPSPAQCVRRATGAARPGGPGRSRPPTSRSTGCSAAHR